MASTIIIPGKDYHNTLYSGIADVFDTYTQNVKRKRKEEEAARKRAAKSTRAKGRGGLRSVKQRLDDESRLAEAEYDASDQKFNDWLTTTKGLRQRDVSQSFPIGPITMDKDEAFPSSYENIITPAGRSEKLRSEYDISTRTSKYNLQKLTEAGQWLQINEKRIYNARIEGDDAKLAKENIKYKKLQNIIKDLEYKIAFNTRKEVEDKIISDAESAESLATKRNIDANIAKQERDWRGGFEATVPAPQMVDAMVVPSQDWPEYKLFDPDLRPDKAKEYIGRGLPQGFINAKEKEEYLKHYGLAEPDVANIVSGRVIYTHDPEGKNPVSAANRQEKTLTKLFGGHINAANEAAVEATGTSWEASDIVAITEAEGNQMVNAILMAASQLSKLGYGFADIIASDIMSEPGYYANIIDATDPDMVFDDPYTDYTPMKASKIVGLYKDRNTEQKFTIDQALQRKAELEAQGKSPTQIKEIMRSEGYK